MLDQEIPIEVHHAAEITMHKSTKLPLRKLPMRRSMPLEVAPLSRNEAALLLQNKNIAWITTFAFTVANLDIKC